MKLSEPIDIKFPTKYSEILQRVYDIDPLSYGKTRNYVNGSVTYLSPYISRGILSTKFIFNQILKRGYSYDQIEKIIQEFNIDNISLIKLDIEGAENLVLPELIKSKIFPKQILVEFEKSLILKIFFLKICINLYSSIYSNY